MDAPNQYQDRKNLDLAHTCAKEAAATGSAPNSEKMVSMGAPSSASTQARASTLLKVAMPSCRRASSAMTTGGSTSGLHRRKGWCVVVYTIWAGRHD